MSFSTLTILQKKLKKKTTPQTIYKIEDVFFLSNFALSINPFLLQ